ncbi:hypothetical protein EXIGLDRAFT_607952 [Exidia glandulosa HHB12029]|uniref:Allergen Asp f 4 n=1 Tax=Exidia glandulosa HHB12029 TaxID=1314781 RepID=A0A165L976_EXIGL|nr:hypothetical protein EXIGLDRAFT_607952 [Exidia glandulosa HHB12029]
MDGDFCVDGFGGRTPGHETGETNTYVGNVGDPWGSNIITVDSALADQYKYTIKFVGSSHMTEPYKVVIWNKIGPDGQMTGWYGNSAVSFSLAPGAEQYVAFDENSQGGWGAAPGNDLPKDQWGGYDSTWGEFDFGDQKNNAWSGFDVSMIQAEAAGAAVQGMQICDVTNGPGVCSTITTNGARVDNAYKLKDAPTGGIGGNLGPGKVRLETIIEFND